MPTCVAAPGGAAHLGRRAGRRRVGRLHAHAVLAVQAEPRQQRRHGAPRLRGQHGSDVARRVRQAGARQAEDEQARVLVVLGRRQTLVGKQRRQERAPRPMACAHTHPCK